jgi:hypothetical protein
MDGVSTSVLTSQFSTKGKICEATRAGGTRYLIATPSIGNTGVSRVHLCVMGATQLSIGATWHCSLSSLLAQLPFSPFLHFSHQSMNSRKSGLHSGSLPRHMTRKRFPSLPGHYTTPVLTLFLGKPKRQFFFLTEPVTDILSRSRHIQADAQTVLGSPTKSSWPPDCSKLQLEADEPVRDWHRGSSRPRGPFMNTLFGSDPPGGIVLTHRQIPV